MQDNNSDLQACLSIQPRRSHAVPARKTQELASQLLSLVNDDSARAIAIIREIMYYSPNCQIDWYYQRAIEKLNRQLCYAHQQTDRVY